MEWIFFTVFAALMQSVRTAGQKQMTNNLSALVATWARYGFGLPLAIIYFFTLWSVNNFAAIETTFAFWLYLFICSVAQLLATVLLVKVLSMRNFTVGTAYAKSEGLLAGIIGALFFTAVLSALAWLAIVIGVAGLMLVSVSKTHGQKMLNRTALYGLGAGLFFAITSIFIREATMQLTIPKTLSAAFILMLSLFIQGAICTLLVHQHNTNNWRQLRQHIKLGWFVGITGTLGSIGWFTAFAYQEAALVKTLGNIEFLFTLFITYGLFKERITKTEWIGIVSITASVVLLIFSF